MLKPPEFKQSRETQIIYDLLKECLDRDDPILTWSELTKATGIRSREKLRGFIYTACRRILADHGKVFECDRNIGYRLVRDAGLAAIGQKTIEHTRRQHRKTIKKMDTVDFSKLDVRERTYHITRQTVLELALQASRPSIISKAEQAAIRNDNFLGSDEMIQELKDAISGKKKYDR